MDSFKESLWKNIHKKRKEGRPMRKPGADGAPSDQDFKNARGESTKVNEISPEKKKEYKSKAGRDLPQRTKYADNYQAAAKLDPSNVDYKKRGDDHRRKEKNRMKGITSVTDESMEESVEMVCKDCGCSFGEPVPDCNCPHDSSDPEGSNWIHSDETNEALNMQQRLQRSRSAKRNKQKMARGRKRAEKKTATPDIINKRAVKAARKSLYKKLTKGATDLSPGRKKELETRLDKPNMKNIIQRLAKKLRPTVRGLEKKRRASRNKS